MIHRCDFSVCCTKNAHLLEVNFGGTFHRLPRSHQKVSLECSSSSSRGKPWISMLEASESQSHAELGLLICGSNSTDCIETLCSGKLALRVADDPAMDANGPLWPPSVVSICTSGEWAIPTSKVTSSEWFGKLLSISDGSKRAVPDPVSAEMQQAVSMRSHMSRDLTEIGREGSFLDSTSKPPDDIRSSVSSFWC